MKKIIALILILLSFSSYSQGYLERLRIKERADFRQALSQIGQKKSDYCIIVLNIDSDRSSLYAVFENSSIKLIEYFTQDQSHAQMKMATLIEMSKAGYTFISGSLNYDGMVFRR